MYFADFKQTEVYQGADFIDFICKGRDIPERHLMDDFKVINHRTVCGMLEVEFELNKYIIASWIEEFLENQLEDGEYIEISGESNPGMTVHCNNGFAVEINIRRD